MITFSQKGDFKRLNGFLERAKETINLGELDKYGKLGVQALSNATPRNTGKTAESWYYTIEHGNGHASINWCNSNVKDGCNIAIILQYGHGTRRGGYVNGKEYINEALRPVFDKLAESAWKEVTSK